MTEKFTDRLYRNNLPIQEKKYEHPFVVGIGKGTLEKEKFIHYMKQDYVYLIEYSKLFAIGVQKAHDLDTMERFAKVLHNTLHFEMELHRQYAEEFGITREELEKTEPAPMNIAYTSYMLKAGAIGDLAELVACLLPCAWDYWEIGKYLKEKYAEYYENNPYKKWIDTYTSETFANSAKYLINLMDELAEGKSDKELNVLERHFQITSKFEYLFWDMNDKKEEWPI